MSKKPFKIWKWLGQNTTQLKINQIEQSILHQVKTSHLLRSAFKFQLPEMLDEGET